MCVQKCGVSGGHGVEDGDVDGGGDAAGESTAPGGALRTDQRQCRVIARAGTFSRAPEQRPCFLGGGGRWYRSCVIKSAYSRGGVGNKF